MWFGTSVWSPLQKKTDRGETACEEQERGGVVRPQGCWERSPQIFHHCCRHYHGGAAASEQSQGQCEADAKCVCVCVWEWGGERNMEEKARQGQSDCVGSRQSTWWLMKLKVRSGNRGAAGGGGERGVERSFGPKLWLTPPPPAAALPQPSSLPVCVWCLFTSLFNHGAVPVVDWHKMTAA